MSDDEAFIRAVVSAPGHDAPRLIYTDWLDERGDSRGAYLRAEAKWDRRSAHGVHALREAGRGLDPVWVARVSRPPVGVCVAPTKFIEAGRIANSLDELAIQYQFRWPDEYRAFLGNWNGGEFAIKERPHFPGQKYRPKFKTSTLFMHGLSPVSEELGDLRSWIEVFLNPQSHREFTEGAVEVDREWEMMWLHRRGDLKHYVPIGFGNVDTAQAIMLGVTGQYFGRVHLTHAPFPRINEDFMVGYATLADFFAIIE